MDGLIAVNKEQNMTSHDVCFKVKKLLHTKTGHTGTLDPMAEGVLLVMCGRATRLSRYLSLDDKEYIAKIAFGKTSDTHDIWGEVKNASLPVCTEEEFSEALRHFTGDIMQYPPVYSAIKYQGKHLYEYARKGQDVEILPRKVRIHSIQIMELNLPYSATVRISCSKGTYIRSLCRDIGEYLHSGAVMESLIRTRIGNFTIDNSFTLEEIGQKENKRELFYSEKDALSFMPRFDVRKESARIVLSGNLLIDKNLTEPLRDREEGENEFVRLYCDDIFIGIGRHLGRDGIKPCTIVRTELHDK